MNVPRDLVHAAMYQVDPDALEQRAPKFKKKHLKVVLYHLISTLSTHLMGTKSWWAIKIVLFQLLSRGVLICAAKRGFGWKFGYPTAIQILLDVFLQYLFKTRRVASKLRLDRGTETSGMATMHAYLPQQHSVMEDFHVMNMVIYGPSTSNQVRVALVSWNQDRHYSFIVCLEKCVNLCLVKNLILIWVIFVSKITKGIIFVLV